MTSDLSSLATNIQTHFPHQTFPQFSGKPTFSQVRQIEKLVERNAGKIKTSVEGAGAFNHIFLVKTPEDWTALTNLPPLAIPEKPADPVIGNHATAAQIAQINLAYERRKKVYDTTQVVKDLLTNQIVSAFDADYISALQHPVTKTVDHHTIPEIFALLYRYGRVQIQAVRDREAELLAQPLNLELPLCVLFEKIEDFRSLASAAKEPKSSIQIINLTLDIIKRSGNVFREALIAWDDKPANEQTWVNLKEHLDTAHRKLQNASDLPLGQSSLQQEAANMVKETQASVDTSMHHRMNNMEQAIHRLLQVVTQQQVEKQALPPSTTSTFIDDTSTLTDYHPNVLHQQQMNNMQTQHQKEITELKMLLQKATQQLAQQDSRKQGDTPNTTAPTEGKKYYEGGTFRRHLDHYCWSHGACNHPSSECSKPLKGHKKEATFDNMMNGSYAFCRYRK